MDTEILTVFIMHQASQEQHLLYLGLAVFSQLKFSARTYRLWTDPYDDN